MDIDRVRGFAARHHRAVMTVRTPDGDLRPSPVLVGVDDGGRFVVSSRETAYKTRHVRSEGWAQLCVFTDAFFGSWYYVEGPTDVLSLPDAMEPLVDYYRRVAGEHDDWDDYRSTMERERRVLLRLSATHAGPDRQG